MPAALMAAGILAGFAQPGTAQTVQGQLVETGTDLPVEGALVLLLTEGGEEAGGYLTNQAGRFLIRAPGPGTYTLRAERIGYETITSDPFSLEQSQQFGIRIEAAQSAIELEGIRVEGEQRCVVRPGEGLQLADVWNEARKALTVQDWTEREGDYRFDVARYERELDVNGKNVRSETRQVMSNVRGIPIQSLPVEDLLKEGFVRDAGDRAYEYFGPDASVLLSDQFLDTHCLRLTADPLRDDRLGLAFEPVRRGGIPDISGTLWLDAETASLQVLEYTYTWAPWDEVRGVARGQVDFENLPSGAWVISNWWIRMPLVEMEMGMAVTQRTSGIRLIGFKEVGGGITRFTSLEAGETTEMPTGVLEGQVWDSTRQTPLAGATVFLSGTQYATETDARGTFVISDLPQGFFTAAFTHPRLDSLGALSTGVEVTITPGEFTSLMLAIPASASISDLYCTEEELSERSAVVIGFVREADSETPVAGATVILSWSLFDKGAGARFTERREGLQTTTDATGRYSACGIPLDTTLRIRATHLDRETETVEAWGRENGYTVVHLVFPGSAEPTPLPSS